MGPMLKTYNKSLITELAEAISSFNIADVINLLSESGEYVIQNERNEIVFSDKDGFIEWLSIGLHKFIPAGKSRHRLNFTIIQCLHSVKGNPIIIFEDGKFPVFQGKQKKGDKSGFVIMSDDNTITGIGFCLLVLKTENPFIYEKKNLFPES
jgi:hypothetical protein